MYIINLPFSVGSLSISPTRNGAGLGVGCVLLITGVLSSMLTESQ